MDSPEHLTPQSFRYFAATVSMEPDLDAKRAFVKQHQQNINESILYSLENRPARETFALLDAAKSVVTRDVMLAKRFGAPDVLLHGTLDHHIDDMLNHRPEVVFVNFFQSPTSDFWALLAFRQDGDTKVEKVPIATGQAGQSIHQIIMDYAAVRAGVAPKDSGVDLLPALQTFGAEILPRIQRMGGTRRVVLIPHKALHMLPLHLMVAESESAPLFLDLLAQSTIYGSSLFALYFGNVSIKKETARPNKSVLACVDVEGLGPSAIYEAEAYRETLHNSTDVDIVTAAEDFPEDLSCYPLLMWSSHGVSHASDWRQSRLLFGKKVITAMDIIERWNLEHTYVGVLSACETGIDFSTDDVIDEYCGLDMALNIAGARTVVSTMWMVPDVVAQFVNSLVFEAVLMGEPASSMLKTARLLMMSGGWREVLEKTYADIKSLPDGREARKKIVERLLDVPDALFQDFRSWGVYRCFGGW